MAGYTRNDTTNNIATGNIINASDLDGEFDAIQGAFNETTGHVHDGTTGNGAPITKVGPTQDVNISGTAVTPKTDNAVDLGSSTLEFKDLWIDGTANIDALVADTATISAGTITGITDLAIADGGTGASDAATARTNLGLAIGTNVQAYDPDLAAIAALTPTADNFIVGDGTTWILETPSQARTSLGATTVGANLFTLSNPSAITFPRINADNTVSTLTAANFRTAISSAASGANSDITSLSGLTTALSVGQGGTGRTTLTANNVVLGNGTSAVNFVAPGTNGNVLTSNGTTWVSQAASSLSGKTNASSPFETSLGDQAGNLNTGINNVFIGYQTGANNTNAANNTAVGYQALFSSSTQGNIVAVGYRALYSAGNSSAQNTAVGYQALTNLTSGNQSAAFGYNALLNATTSINNTAIGNETLRNTDANDNTALGNGAGYSVTTGQQNTLLGSRAGMGGVQLSTGSNNILIGYEASPSAVNVSNETTIGNSSTTNTRIFGRLTMQNGSLQEDQVAIAASNIDLSLANYYTRTISGTTTFTVSNVPTSGFAISFILDLTNGGSATVNWWSGVKWAGGTAPTLTASGRDVLGFYTHDGGTTWNGFLIGKDVK